MGLRGPAFYDDDGVFEVYWSRRGRLDNPNDTLELPVVWELLGDVAGRRILDLGCGDATFGSQALERGCAAYCGVDGSRNMIATARRLLAGTAGEAIHADLETWNYPEAAFDVVVSRLVLHYLESLETVLAGIHRALIEAGRLVVSVEHPVITSCDRNWHGQGLRQDWIVDDYFVTGRRETAWLGGRVVKYHRTVEDYFLALQRAGFRVEGVREARPQPERFTEAATYERRMRIPLFLLMAAQKEAAGRGGIRGATAP